MAKIKPSVLVDGAKKFYDEGYGYIYGASGGIWTQADQNRVDADPNGREQTKKWGSKWIGKHVIDCSGIPYRIFKQNGISISHSSNSQYLKYCPNHGILTKDMVSSLIPGAGIFKYSTAYANPYFHVGIYIGNGELIEAKGTYYGVVKATVDEWLKAKNVQTHYGYWKNVDWDGAVEDMKYMETLKRGSKGESVVALQTKLNALGYDCGNADGIFGTKTYNAVKAFQEANGITADGIAGYNTLTLLDQIPVVETPTVEVVTGEGVALNLSRTTAEDLYKSLSQALYGGIA